jgi:glucuronate isomerase
MDGAKLQTINEEIQTPERAWVQQQMDKIFGVTHLLHKSFWKNI